MDQGIWCENKRHQRDINAMDVEVNASDRISHLPDHIIHQIVSFLPTIDVVRISILSETWHRISTSFHVWDFEESWFGLPNVDLYSEAVEKREKILNFVHNSLVRECHQNSSIQRLRLSLTFYCTSVISSRIAIFDCTCSTVWC